MKRIIFLLLLVGVTWSVAHALDTGDLNVKGELDGVDATFTSTVTAGSLAGSSPLYLYVSGHLVHTWTVTLVGGNFVFIDADNFTFISGNSFTLN